MNTFGDKSYYVADSNMPYDWWNFLGPNRVVNPDRADIVLHTDAFIGPVDHSNTVAILIESQAIHPHAYSAIQRYYDQYRSVLTFDRNTLELPNSQLCYFGGGWVAKEDWAMYPKTKNLSMTLSHKRYADGHIRRHECYEAIKDRLDGAHGFMNPIPNTLAGLKDFRFNICVENTRCDYYFSEKLLDCFSTGTIPVYCGCPSISLLFNTNGIMEFETVEDMLEWIPQCTEETYEKARPAIEDNMTRMATYWSYEVNIDRALKNCGAA